MVTPAGRVRPDGGVPAEPGDALVVATRGTTGEPKGVVHTHASVTASAVPTSAGLAVDPARDRWVACLPLAHIGGLSVVTRSLVTGTPCTVLERFDAAAVEDEARPGRHARVAGGHRARPVRRLGLPGGPAGRGRAPPALPDQRRHHLRHDRDGLGLRLRRPSPRRRRAPHRRRRPGPAGEVLVRGPMLLRAYRDGTDPALAGGWLPTGDGGRLEDDGTLAVFGRMAEVIVTGGEKVWPIPVEDVLATPPVGGRGGGVEAARSRVG